MIAKTEALVLRWYPVTETSRMVVWLTHDQGRVTTVVKGAQRPKSWSLGQFDLFYTCELLYYTRGNEEVHHFRECTPLIRRGSLRRDWRAAALASVIADACYRTTLPRTKLAEHYELATLALDHLAVHGASAATLFWFELNLLGELGFAPQVQRSIAHGEKLSAHEPGLRFAYEMGGVLAPGEQARGVTAPITGGALAILQRLNQPVPPSDLAHMRITRAQALEISDHLDAFLRWHGHGALPSRALGLDLLYRELDARGKTA